jgi:Family of unknown function (DUF5719)
MTRLSRPSWLRRPHLRRPHPATGLGGVRRVVSSPRLRSPGCALIVVVVLLLVGLGVGIQTEPARSGTLTPLTQRQKFVPVARASAVCPDTVADATTTTSVTLAAPGAIDDQTPTENDAAAGSAGLHPLGAGSPVTAKLTAVSSIAADVAASAQSSQDASDTGADGQPLVAVASGALAPGFTASMTTRSTSDDIRGLASTACTTPGNDFWFVGSGAIIGRRGRLYLTNPESVPAVVDVTLYGPEGQLDAPSGRGVTLAAGAQQVLKLDALAPDVERFGIHVQVRQGRVAAALRDQQIQGLTPMGADWVPAAQPPAHRLVLPGVPAGAGERRLQIVVPGDSDAIVKVRLIGVDGSFVPSGLDVVEARAGRVSDVDLAPFTGAHAVGVELTSDQPVTAGVLVRVGGVGKARAEMAYTAAAAPISAAAPGVATDLRGSKAGTDTASNLVLAAPDLAATVQLDVLPPATGTPIRVRVPAGGQVTVAADTLSQDASFAVTLVPSDGSGPVMAASQLSEADPSGPLLTVLLISPSRYAVQVPQVVADLSTGLRPPGAGSTSVPGQDPR